MKLTRRSLLQGLSGTIAAAMLPVERAAAGEPAGPVMIRLSTYMAPL